MYKHILIATDGSKISNKAIPHAIELAKAFGATLSAVTVTYPYEAGVAAEVEAIDTANYNEQSEESAAEIILSFVTSAADAAGIKCAALHRQNRSPYEGIIKAAEKVGADLIVIGSHGRRGIDGLLIGSQTTKLLTHTKIPALVVR
jgi:nucleotide-binding universal stress UspA family protein